jgi:hypothetical protein
VIVELDQDTDRFNTRLARLVDRYRHPLLATFAHTAVLGPDVRGVDPLATRCSETGCRCAALRPQRRKFRKEPMRCVCQQRLKVDPPQLKRLEIHPLGDRQACSGRSFVR